MDGARDEARGEPLGKPPGGARGEPRLAAPAAVKLPRNWHRLCRKVLRRCGRRCEWQRSDLGLRCQEPAAVVVHIGKLDDHSLPNLQGLCTWHAAQKAARDWELSRFIAIRVRPAPHEETK